MADQMLMGRSLTAIARDVADGYMSITPLTLKKFDETAMKALIDVLLKAQKEARGASFPTHDLAGIRQRNMRLQRLHNALIVAQNLARERRIRL